MKLPDVIPIITDSDNIEFIPDTVYVYKNNEFDEIRHYHEYRFKFIKRITNYKNDNYLVVQDITDRFTGFQYLNRYDVSKLDIQYIPKLMLLSDTINLLNENDESLVKKQIIKAVIIKFNNFFSNLADNNIYIGQDNILFNQNYINDHTHIKIICNDALINNWKVLSSENINQLKEYIPIHQTLSFKYPNEIVTTDNNIWFIVQLNNPIDVSDFNNIKFKVILSDLTDYIDTTEAKHGGWID